MTKISGFILLSVAFGAELDPNCVLETIHHEADILELSAQSLNPTSNILNAYSEELDLLNNELSLSALGGIACTGAGSVKSTFTMSENLTKLGIDLIEQKNNLLESVSHLREIGNRCKR
jgi:hypothetical protein